MTLFKFTASAVVHVEVEHTDLEEARKLAERAASFCSPVMDQKIVREVVFCYERDDVMDLDEVEHEGQTYDEYDWLNKDIHDDEPDEEAA